MSQRKLVRVDTSPGKTEWLHHSRLGEQIWVRSFNRAKEDPAKSPELGRQLDEAAGRELSLQRAAALTEDVVNVSADKLPVTDADGWRLIIARLNELSDDDLWPQAVSKEKVSVDFPPPTTGRRSPIPQTRLRRFYEMLRIFNTSELQQELVSYLLGGSRFKKIEEMFRESHDHFEQYSNVEEPFREPGTRKWTGTDGDKFAHCLAARLKPVGTAAPWKAVSGREVRAVDYEVSPFRTTKSEFECGKPGSSSGGGGIDLLLTDNESRLIVGEIKAKTDTNIFLALIQALTYAAELTTVSQTERLMRAYPDDLSTLHQHQHTCEVWLIFEKGKTDPALLKETQVLARQLMKGAEIGKRVCRIDFVSAQLLEGDVQLSCSASYPGSTVHHSPSR